MISDEFLKHRTEQKKIFDLISGKYLCGIDLEVCKYVTKQMVPVDLECLNMGEIISRTELVERSLEEVKKFGLIPYLRVKNLSSKIPLNVNEETILRYEHCFDFEYNLKSGEVLSWNNSAYIISPTLYDLSVYMLTHEHMHALKDINLNEFRDTLVEVIPLFYELMIFDSDEKMKRELMRYRLGVLYAEGVVFSECNKELINGEISYSKNLFDESDCETYGLYNFARSDSGKYLNSFYYSMMLYLKYQENPRKILHLVSKVLNNRLTTFELLNKLGIYGDIKSGLFEKEVGKIRKYVK